MHDFSIYYLKYSFNLFKTTCEKKIFIIFAPSEYLVIFVVCDQVGFFFSQFLKRTHSNFLMYMNKAGEYRSKYIEGFTFKTVMLNNIINIMNEICFIFRYSCITQASLIPFF